VQNFDFIKKINAGECLRSLFLSVQQHNNPFQFLLCPQGRDTVVNSSCVADKHTHSDKDEAQQVTPSSPPLNVNRKEQQGKDDTRRHQNRGRDQCVWNQGRDEESNDISCFSIFLCPIFFVVENSSSFFSLIHTLLLFSLCVWTGDDINVLMLRSSIDAQHPLFSTFVKSRVTQLFGWSFFIIEYRLVGERWRASPYPLEVTCTYSSPSDEAPPLA
jgi:hypothetical protein